MHLIFLILHLSEANMSRIGKQPIILPNEVKVEFHDHNISIEGPKGKLNYNLPKELTVEKTDNVLKLNLTKETKPGKALWGLWRSLLANAFIGVTKGYEKKLELFGMGYRGKKEGDALILQVGFSHPVKYKPLPGVEANIEKNIITVAGIDKQKVGEVAAQIRHIKKPEPYKGKGIHYVGEEIKLKPGKTAKAVGGMGK